MKTRDKIIDIAVQLFNEHGTKAISTNHIAAAAGISPGNLYYHFRNKEDIIRAIFEQMDAYGVEQYQIILDNYPPGTIEALERTFIMIQEYNWQYRFFKRELTALIMNDTLLKERFHATNNQMKDMIRFTIDGGISNGSIKPMSVGNKEHFVDAIWLVALFWLNYLEVGGEEVNKTTLRRGNHVLRTVLSRYLMDDSAVDK
ncbi:MAG: TetR family transcriptional regulator [Desulfobulbaceae bacterium S3730MH12]|nr:MAG: TetR family transcriptional regulator [Desulfobulbaceae bacterium S5133MH15]OEU54752.1 MAG: TetR family transcriptional regulator [Desulfobulbaceae bacterium S3730MH12]OEU84120.1 MAG: TetR family transcriptional regulator [Desulfobulbaceae bacterium C00003063]